MRLFAITLIAGLPLLAASSAELERAQKLYRYTDYDGSMKILQAMPQKDAAVFELIGRNWYMQGEYKKATENLEKALAAEPEESDYALWLGRAYGRRAETSSPFTALGSASKARQNFEKAVRLNPRNLEALSDLFEYYLEAPGFVGGGLDKAVKVAEQMGAVDEVEGHWALARLAEKKKEYGTAEEHLERAAQMAPQQVGKLLDLARFLAKQGRYQESEQKFQKAEKIAPNSPRVIYARADTYIQQGRNLETARRLLKQYLEAELTPDDPPRAEAEKLLKKASGG
jgi:tetratricopeptide (TPR) repeat protein